MLDLAITLATPADHPRLFAVWESSVRATHHFLSEAQIAALAPFVRGGLATFAPIHVLRDLWEQPIAFLGVADGAIEMLFVHADHRHRGAGRRLVEFAIETLAAHRVDVDEQNPQAIGFYRALGFRAVARSPRDGQGNPFPLLHLLLDNHAARVREAAA